MATLPGFKRLPGRSERFLVVATGQEISRRKYDLIRRGLSNEQLAKINAVAEPEEQLARPARGRTSVRKLAPEIKKDIVNVRKEFREKKKQIAAQEKEEAKLARRIETIKGKKVKVKKFTTAMLKAGHYGRRLAFNTHEDYETLYADAKKSGKVIFYGLGMDGYDERTGTHIPVTVFTMRAFDGLISRDDFYDAMNDYLESRPYYIFVSFFMHLAFSREFAEDRMRKAGMKVRVRQARR